MLTEQQQPCSQDGTLTVRNGPTVTAPCRIFPKCSSTYPSFIESLLFLAGSWPVFCSEAHDQGSRGEKSSGGGSHGVDGVHNPDEDYIEYDSVLDEPDVAFKDASAGAPQKDRKFAQRAFDDLVKDKSFFKDPKHWFVTGPALTMLDVQTSLFLLITESSNHSKPICAPNRRVPWESPKRLKQHFTTSY